MNQRQVVVTCFILFLTVVSAFSIQDLIGAPSKISLEDSHALGKQWRSKNPDTVLPPLILIPGLTGSGLNSELKRANLPLLCEKNQPLERIWINPSKFIQFNCLEKTLVLDFNPVTGNYSNTDGVTVSAVDFGGVTGVNYIGYNEAGQPLNTTDYFAALISYLEGTGYVVSQNLFAAPYDWRLTANPHNFNGQLKSLIEHAYTINENTPVFTLCHSMGNLEFSTFIIDQTPEWRDQYVGGYIAAAAPWSGASLAVRALISGLNIKYGLITVPPTLVANLARTFGSVVWMLPDQYLIGNQPLVVVNTTATYNYQQLDDIFTIIGATETNEIYSTLNGQLETLPLPDVPTYCLYGTNKETELWYEYDDGLFAQPTKIHYDPRGDGVVPLASLQKCLEKEPVACRTFDLVSHGDLVKDPEFFLEITSILSGTASGGCTAL